MAAPSTARGARASARPEQGQSTVEFALLLPLLFTLLLLGLQIALVGRDEIVVVHAARDAARAATVTHDASAIRAAAARTLPGVHVRVLERGTVGHPVRVEVTYVAHTDVPLLGVLLPDITMRAHATMQVEQP